MAGATSTTAYCSIGTNNVDTTDNSQTTSIRDSTFVQETQNIHNHSSNTVLPKFVTMKTTTGGSSTKRRLASIRMLIEQTTEELIYLSNHGCDPAEYDALHEELDQVSSVYFALQRQVKGFFDSWRYSTPSKHLKVTAKDLHNSAMMVSGKIQRDAAREKVHNRPPPGSTSQPSTPTPPTPVPCYAPSIVVERLVIHFH